MSNRIRAIYFLHSSIFSSLTMKGAGVGTILPHHRLPPHVGIPFRYVYFCHILFSFCVWRTKVGTSYLYLPFSLSNPLLFLKFSQEGNFSPRMHEYSCRSRLFMRGKNQVDLQKNEKAPFRMKMTVMTMMIKGWQLSTTTMWKERNREKHTTSKNVCLKDFKSKSTLAWNVPVKSRKVLSCPLNAQLNKTTIILFKTEVTRLSYRCTWITKILFR